MTIRYIPEGNKLKASRLWGEARHQLFILKNLMSFRDLKQLQRKVTFSDGTIIKCMSCFGQDTVNVFVPPYMPAPVEERKIVEVTYCWCNNYFTEGVIEKIIGDYGDAGDYTPETYPDYCNSDDAAVKNYIGIRYEVSLCQGVEGENSTFICVPSDFAEYEVGDEVIVFMRGTWDGTILIEPEGREPGIECVNSEAVCDACEGTTRPDWAEDEPDGAYLIMPLAISGVNV